MTLPQFTAQASLPPRSPGYRGARLRPALNRVVPAQLTFWECMEECEAALDPMECAIICAALFDVTWGAEVDYGPGMFNETGQMIEGGAAKGGAAAEEEAIAGGGTSLAQLAVLAAAVLAAIAAGTFLGYEIEKHGVFTPDPPKPCTPAPSCLPATAGSDKRQHQITSTSRLGCARSEGLAILAADADCKPRAGFCTGGCGSGTCVPYAKVWNTATVTGISNPTGIGLIDIFSSVVNGCSTTAYYTCHCGC